MTKACNLDITGATEETAQRLKNALGRHAPSAFTPEDETVKVAYGEEAVAKAQADYVERTGNPSSFVFGNTAMRPRHAGSSNGPDRQEAILGNQPGTLRNREQAPLGPPVITADAEFLHTQGWWN